MTDNSIHSLPSLLETTSAGADLPQASLPIADRPGSLRQWLGIGGNSGNHVVGLPRNVQGSTLTISKPVCSKSTCNYGDVGLALDNIKGFSDADKFAFTKNVWRPRASFEFPEKNECGKKRKFNNRWFNEFPWLAYSKYLDALGLS